ncbi:VOC family protein [Kitasatospora sp. NPDC094011]|uniref:VOC family protein n=1 Tax=Kitasatospora sp. NPDC094011 TaxID=3364090 RepID=UPI00380DFF7A
MPVPASIPTPTPTPAPVLDRLTTLVVDCADPVALAEFYRQATGWELTHSERDFAALAAATGPGLAFSRVEGHRAPGWPEGRTRLHLDFTVTDPDDAAPALLALGATRPEAQPGEGRWIVLLDPEGHPFCLVRATDEAN